MKKVIIFGTGQFAKIIHRYLANDSDIEVVAFTANESYIKDDSFCGLPVVPFEKVESSYPSSEYQMFVAVGYSDLNKKRAGIFERAKSKGYKLVSYVHPSVVVVGDFEFGENCFVFENSVIQPFVKIGDDVIVWSGSLISHNTTIKDHCFIASHVAIAGSSTIESYCFLGTNCTLRNGIKIAKECVIGAGCVILEDTKEKEVFVTRSTAIPNFNRDLLKDI